MKSARCRFIIVAVALLLSEAPIAVFGKSCDEALAAAGTTVVENGLTAALLMEDSTGKIPSGIFEGNTHSTGSFDQCYLVPEASYVQITVDLAALVKANVTLPSPILLAFAAQGVKPIVGVCMPEACAANVTNFLESSAVRKIFHVGDLTPEAISTGFEWKEIPETIAFSGLAIFLMLFVGLLVMLSFAGSVLSEGGLHGCFETRIRLKDRDDKVKDKKRASGKEDDVSLLLKIVRCFSFTENLRTLTNMEQRFPQTASLEGLRVFSMQWVILGHTLLVLISGNLDNSLYLLNKVAPRFTYQPVINATVSVDSFFTISGFLLAYVSLRKLRKITAKSNTPQTYVGTIFMFVVHRWLRIVPVLGFVMCVNAELLPSLGNGPLWLGRTLGKACRTYWWTNLLFVNNYHPRNLMDECVGQSWYLGVDMQLFVISVALLVIFQASPRLRKSLLSQLAILFGISAASVALRMWKTHQKHLTAQGQYLPTNSDVEPLSDTADVKGDVYVQTQYRIATYLIGVMAGLILDSIEQRRRKCAKETKSDGASTLSDSLLESGVTPTTGVTSDESAGESKTNSEGGSRNDDEEEEEDLIRATSSTGLGSMEYVPLQNDLRRRLVRKITKEKVDRYAGDSKRDGSDEKQPRKTQCTLSRDSGEIFAYGGALFALGVMGAVLYGLYPSYHGHPTSMTQNVLYVGLNRVAWSLCIAYFILACSTGHLKIVNRILSMPFLLPLSKLSYSCYLSHLLILTVIAGNHRVLYHYTDYALVSLYLLTLFLTYSCAAFLFVMIELPAARIEQLLLPKL